MPDIRPEFDEATLLSDINRQYAIDATAAVLKRARGGYAFVVQSGKGKYLLKLLRPEDTEAARQSTEILAYLREQGYPAITVVSDAAGEALSSLPLNGEAHHALLLDFVEGGSPSARKEAEALGQQAARLHNVMEAYAGPLVEPGKPYFIDRFTALYEKGGFDSCRLDELKDYGAQLWQTLCALPRSFCHGDLHTGNILRTKDSQYVFCDFDAASRTHNLIDLETLSDASNFFEYTPKAYPSTQRRLDRVYQGYTSERTLPDAALRAVMDFIAIRHFEIIPTVLAIYQVDMAPGYMESQWQWLMQWREDCARHRI